ncbi:MAG: class I SAM-dependent methyltransferase [Gemmatimonadota bacterium]
MPSSASGWHLRLFEKSILKQAKLREVLLLLGPTDGLDCLDLGSDNGVISFLLRRRGGRWWSADLAEKSVAAIQELVGERVVRVDGASLPFADASLDAVLVLDMLEHVRTDRELLADVARVLRPGGAAVVNVPHSRRLEPLRPLRERLGLTDAWHGHLRHGYTLGELQALLPPELRVVRTRSYARFFSELLDTVLNAAYARRGRSAGPEAGRPAAAETEKGTVVTGEDLERHRKAFRLLSRAYPALWLVSRLDLLIPFTSGSLLLVRLEKEPPARRTASGLAA